MSAGAVASQQQDWFHGVDLYSRITGRISELTLFEQALLFAELSQIAYMPPAPALTCVQKIGFLQSLYFDRDGAQAYLFRNQYDCVVVCRGTQPNEWNDVKADANAVTVVAETIGRVHGGFKREVDDLWPILERVLVDNDWQPLWFAGHSLGGAMATICARRCKFSRVTSNPKGLFTYGSPRVGDRAYVNFCRLPHFRWVNNNDIVTRMPPMWFGYRHDGREMYINSTGRVRAVEGWRRVVDRLWGLVRGMGRLNVDCFSDHSIEDYIAHIHAAVPKPQWTIPRRVPRRSQIAAT